jgi:general secretion pathway protein D
MRKILLALLIGGVAVIGSKVSVGQLLADATSNFEPARKPSTLATETATPVAPTSTPTTASQPTAKTATANVAPSKSAPPLTAGATSEAALVAQEELMRRQAAQVQAKAMIAEGQKLSSSGKYDQAVSKLEDALKILPRATATETDYDLATHLLVNSYNQLALQAYNAKDYVKAQSYGSKALEYDPHNSSAENIIVKAKQAELHPAGPPPMPPPSQTPAFQAEQGEVRKLFREGKLLMNSGQFDEAEERFQQILVIDPYNTDAYQFLQQITAARGPSTEAGIEANRRNMLWQADNDWVPPVKGAVKVPKLEGQGQLLMGGPAASGAILQRLNDIVFPQLEFRNASIADVVVFLSDQSRKLDPQSNGVNIVLGPGIGAEAPPPTAPSPEVGGTPPSALTAPGGGEGARPITLSLRDVPMIEALKYITRLGNLKYLIEPSAVLIVSTNEAPGQMITRTFQLNPGVFVPSMEVTNPPSSTQRTQTTGGGGGGVTQTTAAEQSGPSYVLPDLSIAVLSSNQIRQTFIDAGVEFPPGSALFYYNHNSTLIVRNTPENMELIERVLAVLNDIPKQIEIEAKFVEIGQNDLDALSFNWFVGPYKAGDVVISGGQPSTTFPGTTPNPNANGNNVTSGLRDQSAIIGNAVAALLGTTGTAGTGGTVGSIRGILTNPQFQVIINALSQKGSADVLSAPKVTTISGVQAQIRVAQEFIYPTTYTAATVVPGQSAGTGAATQPVVTPATPGTFAMRPVGVVFNVTPTVGADGYTINLTLIPQVTSFLGFIDYGSVIVSEGITVPNPIKQPLFSTRDIMTSVEIWDGQTVVLGGLINEEIQKIDDKVPFLGDIPGAGRLFRSKVSQRVKRNLLIFVTARIVDPSGRPVHSESAPLAVK